MKWQKPALKKTQASYLTNKDFKTTVFKYMQVAKGQHRQTTKGNQENDI